MSEQAQKALAEALESDVKELLAGMTEVLRKHGIDGVSVVSFTVSDPAAKSALESTPCPVVCIPLNGGVRCFPQC